MDRAKAKSTRPCHDAWHSAFQAPGLALDLAVNARDNSLDLSIRQRFRCSLPSPKLMRNLVILTVLFVALVVSAKADPIPMSPELKAFLMRPDQTQAVVGMMAQQWHMIFENCSSPKLQGMNVFIDSPPQFDSSGAPISGKWRMIGRIEGCGETHIFKVEYLFTPDGQMKRVALLPGTTIADLLLQRDALIFAAAGMAKLTPKDCKDIKDATTIDTKFLAFGEANTAMDSDKRPWTEEWTVRSCGVTGIVTMHFTPDATGTGIRSISNETRPVSP